MEDNSEPGVSEPGSCIRRFEHFTFIRIQKHIRGGHSALGHERGDLRRVVVRVLDSDFGPSSQIRLHSSPGQRQWRGRDFRTLLAAVSTRPSQLAPQLPGGGWGALRLQGQEGLFVVIGIGAEEIRDWAEDQGGAGEARRVAEAASGSCFDWDLHGHWRWCSYACYFRFLFFFFFWFLCFDWCKMGILYLIVVSFIFLGLDWFSLILCWLVVGGFVLGSFLCSFWAWAFHV